MTVLELLSKNKNNPRASDDAMLLWLYDRWKSEEGQKLQHQLEKREIERDTPRAIFLYDSSSFKYIFEEAANDCLEIANEEVFTHWFWEEDVSGRLLELLDAYDKNDVVLVHSFFKDLRCLQGAKDNNNISYRYKDSKNPRASILYECALCVAADMNSYDKYFGWYKTDNNLFSCFKSTVKKYIENSGYEGVNWDNVIDAYIAYSIYRSMPKLKAYKERINMEKELRTKALAESKKNSEEKDLNESELLQESAKTLYCKEDFEAWLEEMQDPELRGWAKECICEALRVMNISCKPNGSYDYYKSVVDNHASKTRKIISYTEMENQLLILLFENWISKSGKKLHEKITERSGNPPMSLQDYYSVIFIYFKDDIGRLGGSVKCPQNLWFADEKKIVERLSELFKNCPGCSQKDIADFVQSMRLLEGLYSDEEHQVPLYRLGEITRNNLLWLSYDYTISQEECFGHMHHESFPQVMDSFLGSDELKKAGFEAVNYQNCLDVYLAFSAYRQINSLPKRKRGK